MTAWKTIERTVAAILGGVRSWGTEHDVLVPITEGNWDPRLTGDPRDNLMMLHRVGVLRLASVEVKHLKGPTVAQLEAFLAKNQEKIDRDIPGAVNALVVKRKAGRGAETPFLLVMPLSKTSQSIEQMERDEPREGSVAQ